MFCVGSIHDKCLEKSQEGSMSIEQTDQLIQLILNSVVMVVACTFLLGGLLRRHNGVGDRLQQIQHQYFDALGSGVESRTGQMTHLKKQLHRLRHRYRCTHYSVLSVHYALLFLTGSTFLMALRTVFETDMLIKVALALFIFGVAVLLLAIGLTLHDLQFSDRSLWREMRLVSNQPESKSIAVQPIASKPIDPKPTDPKPTDSKPVDPKLALRQRILPSKPPQMPEKAEQQRLPDIRVN
jgi:hypothetical protein